MHGEVLLAQRFRLVSRLESEGEDVERWSATDTRRHVPVELWIASGDSLARVRGVAERLRRLSDRRFPRVAATGRSNLDGRGVAYVALTRDRSISLTRALEDGVVTPDLAAAVIGATGRALMAAADAGIRHGHLDASRIGVTRDGRVMVSGLGLIAAAHRSSPLESDDAEALHGLVATLVPHGVASSEGAPDEMPPGLEDLLDSARAGRLATSLSAVVDPLGLIPRDSLRELARRAEAPAAFIAGEAEEASESADDALEGEPDAGGDGDGPAVAAAAVVAGAAAVDAATAGDAPAEAPVEGDDEASDDTTAVPLVEPAADTDELESILGPFIEDEAIDPDSPIDQWHLITEDHAHDIAPSETEQLFIVLHERWPGIAFFGKAREWAHRRALNPPGMNWGPLLIAAALVAIALISWQAWAQIQSPLDPDFDLHNPPPASYPEFTRGPSPSASADE